MKDPFDLLEIHPDDSDEDIKKSYLEKIKLYPPDHFPERFKEIKTAYESIKTVKDRISQRLFHTSDPSFESFLSLAEKKQPNRFNKEELLQFISQLLPVEMKPDKDKENV